MKNRLKLLVLLTLSPGLVSSKKLVPDTNDKCELWASKGECDKNPGYMLKNCATSCGLLAKQVLKEKADLQPIGSFFDLHAKDIHGNPIDFKKFEGQATIVVNVASECGYTHSHYVGLVQLWKQLAPTKRANILAFPCNQFGHQEPGTPDEIFNFSAGYGVEFTMMEKVDVNGPNASLVYKYLKAQAGPEAIAWNFATYYLVSPDGKIEAHSGVEPLELAESILSLVQSDEL